MSDFNLLGFLNVNVPNEPLTPVIVEKKENSKILSPLKKPEPSTPKKSFESSGNQRTPGNNGSSLKNSSQNVRNSPFFRTTYGQSFGTESPTSSTFTDVDADQAPDTPKSISSVSSISSTISQCNDPECDDCLNKKLQADKSVLAAHEKELDRLGFEESVRKTKEAIAQDQKKEEEKRQRERLERERDMERLRAEREAERVQKEKENAEVVAMQKALSRIDNSALEAEKARNREYGGAVQNQIAEDRARHAAEIELERQQEVQTISFGEDEAVLDARRRAADRENARILEQQIEAKRHSGDAEFAADVELKKRFIEEEAAAKALKAAEDEQNRIRGEELLKKNRVWLAEKERHEQAALDEEREYDRIHTEAERLKNEEEKRKKDEKTRADLELLHQQLADQVQRRKAALQQAREDDKVFVAHAAPKKKKPTLVHCVDCERDLTSDHFSNLVVTPNGKIYKKSKAIPKNSPLHKFLHPVPSSSAYDFGDSSD